MYAIVLIVLLVLAYYYFKNRKATTADDIVITEQKVRLGDLQPNEIINENLTDIQLQRIANFHQILVEVDQRPLSETVDNFKRDTHPDKEIEIMEKIAGAYQAINAQMPELNMDQKKEVYNLMLLRTMMTKEEALENVNLFDKSDASKIIEFFEQY
ncbi:MAG: hypothetical protein KDC49_05635 [Saprospiraceae bacterium]|nr:hypothetical protein [Saprospiraceae bacterium]